MRGLIRTVRCLLLLAGVVLGSPAAAQPTTIYLMRPEVTAASCPYPGCNPGPALLVEVSVEDARVVSSHPIPFERAARPLPVATADGRYLVWAGHETPQGFPSDNLSLFDRVTRTASVVFRPPVRPGLFVPYHQIVAHPGETRVFARLRDLPTIDASLGGIRALDIGGESQTFHGITGDGSVALISRDEEAVAYLVNTATGAIIGQVPGRPLSFSWAISPDGAFVYGHAIRAEGSDRIHTFTRYDSATGSTLDEREYVTDVSAFEPVRRIDVDPRSGRLYVDIDGGRYRVLDPLTLERVGLVATPLLPLPPSEPYAGRAVSGRLVFDPHHPRAFLLANRPMRPELFDAGVSRIDIVDTNALAIVGGADLGMEVGPTELAVVPRPSAPASLSATVNGTRVTLGWTPGPGPGLATGFRIEAGSAPGLANLAAFNSGTATELVVDGVPPGTYYVRARGTNWGGASGPSDEILVTVP